MNEGEFSGEEQTSDDEVGVLWALQMYQRVIREWSPYLTSNEFVVVMQILDRTIGWQKKEATFRSSKLLEGDRKYGGIKAAMHRSTMMKVMRRLEERGILKRSPDKSRPWLREYQVILSWRPSDVSA